MGVWVKCSGVWLFEELAYILIGMIHFYQKSALFSQKITKTFQNSFEFLFETFEMKGDRPARREVDTRRCSWWSCTACGSSSLQFRPEICSSGLRSKGLSGCRPRRSGNPSDWQCCCALFKKRPSQISILLFVGNDEKTIHLLKTRNVKNRLFKWRNGHRWAPQS